MRPCFHHYLIAWFLCVYLNEFPLQCCAINRNFKATHRGIFDGFFPSRQLSYSVDDGSHISGTVELDLGQAVLVGFHDPLDLWSKTEGTRLSLLFWRIICISLSVSKGFWEQCWGIGSESNRFWDQETLHLLQKRERTIASPRFFTVFTHSFWELKELLKLKFGHYLLPLMLFQNHMTLLETFMYNAFIKVFIMYAAMHYSFSQIIVTKVKCIITFADSTLHLKLIVCHEHCTLYFLKVKQLIDKYIIMLYNCSYTYSRLQSQGASYK